jgi:integrase
MIYRYHKKLRAKGLSNRTIANKHLRLRSWLKFCGVDTSFMPDVPKYEEPIPTIYTPEQVKGILESANEYMGIALRLALMLGLREQEIMYAEWSDIDWHHSVFRVQGKKRKKWKFDVKDYAQRDIPIPQEFITLLKEWQDKRERTTVIVGNDADEPEGHLLRKLKQLARRAGLNCGTCDPCQKRKECEEWFLHRFRATFCTRMLRQTDPRTAQYLMGHSSLETTMAYLAIASSDAMQANANAIKWTE